MQLDYLSSLCDIALLWLLQGSLPTGRPHAIVIKRLARIAIDNYVGPSMRRVCPSPLHDCLEHLRCVYLFNPLGAHAFHLLARSLFRVGTSPDISPRLGPPKFVRRAFGAKRLVSLFQCAFICQRLLPD